ncbi:hypothetical protein CBR_g2940 [Chara braunii]|uniref:Uncharacterized protein n=1 Tax=Chara braunii TaxID=69332 RepID=A0A388KEG5_CHABU|nr:hypothetical protein CBR_g2940 [Chara braunii]|eukprot:GBG68396.1 hypothetical protein CBR_g2940 [Chara braunii]
MGARSQKSASRKVSSGSDDRRSKKPTYNGALGPMGNRGTSSQGPVQGLLFRENPIFLPGTERSTGNLDGTTPKQREVSSAVMGRLMKGTEGASSSSAAQAKHKDQGSKSDGSRMGNTLTKQRRRLSDDMGELRIQETEEEHSPWEVPRPQNGAGETIIGKRSRQQITSSKASDREWAKHLLPLLFVATQEGVFTLAWATSPTVTTLPSQPLANPPLPLEIMNITRRIYGSDIAKGDKQKNGKEDERDREKEEEKEKMDEKEEGGKEVSKDREGNKGEKGDEVNSVRKEKRPTLAGNQGKVKVGKGSRSGSRSGHRQKWKKKANPRKESLTELDKSEKLKPPPAPSPHPPPPKGKDLQQKDDVMKERVGEEEGEDQAREKDNPDAVKPFEKPIGDIEKLTGSADLGFAFTDGGLQSLVKDPAQEKEVDHQPKELTELTEKAEKTSGMEGVIQGGRVREEEGEDQARKKNIPNAVKPFVELIKDIEKLTGSADLGFAPTDGGLQSLVKDSAQEKGVDHQPNELTEKAEEASGMEGVIQGGRKSKAKEPLAKVQKGNKKAQMGRGKRPMSKEDRLKPKPGAQEEDLPSKKRRTNDNEVVFRKTYLGNEDFVGTDAGPTKHALGQRTGTPCTPQEEETRIQYDDGEDLNNGLAQSD